MGPFEVQLEQMRQREPGVVLLDTSAHGRIVRVPGVELAEGWSRANVDVTFFCQAGYPMAAPDCFWTNDDLRLADGRMPQSTGTNSIPGHDESLLWFSWHCQSWNPNRDTLLTWFRAIQQRLRTPS